MAEVQAVKNRDTIQLISHLLKIRHSQQMADIWDVGINIALRISDLLSIKFSDIKADKLTIRESKTGKVAQIILNPKSLEIILRIQKENPQHIYLFQSYRNQQAINKPARPLSRRAVSQTL